MPNLRLVRKDACADTSQTPGMARKEAFARDGTWVGTAQMEPGLVSDWHHHGEYESYIYVAEGRARFEYGAEGREAFEAGPGDFAFIPAHTVHREVNPGSNESVVVLFRTGAGPPVFNVDGPESP